MYNWKMKFLIEWLMSWTNNGKLAIIFFPFLCGLLLISSLSLVKWAQVIITKSKFGGGFVGGILIAGITSFPEMITEISQGLAGTPENGIGDDIGSNAFSVFLIGVGALLFTRYLFLSNLGRWTKISLGMSGGLMLAMSLMLYFHKDIQIGVNGKFALGIIPIFFFLFYIFTIWLSHKYGDEDEEPINIEFVEKHSLREGVLRFTLAAVALMATAFLVNVDVSAFSDPKALNIPSESAGGIFLAITTSLPEVVAFFIFMRKQQPAAAIASLTGSHFFNLGISFFGDMSFNEGATFNKIEMSHHFPLAIMTTCMIALIVVHSVLAWKFKEAFKKKSIYMIIPSITSIGYIVGWILILSFGN